MFPVNVVLDAKKVKFPMRVVLTEFNRIDPDCGEPIMDTANACLVDGRVVTVGHLDVRSSAVSPLRVIAPWTLQSKYTLFKKKLPDYDAGILNMIPDGPEFTPASPIIGENVTLASYFWDEARKKPGFAAANGKIIRKESIELYDELDRPFLLNGINQHLRYTIEAPLCPRGIRCGSSVINKEGKLIGITNGRRGNDWDIRHMSSIMDILNNT